MQINLIQNRHYRLFKKISSVAAEQQQSVYVIGGFVRDLLLERATDATDIDFVTEQSGIHLAEACARALGDQLKVTVFKNYGTAMFRYQKTELEFVGARRESYRPESRNPVVEGGTLEDDQLRRDFTINALAISLNQDSFGQLIDPFGGVDDLTQKIIRTPLQPAETFRDDPLRMLRAIRFACTLQFELYPETKEAISAEKDRIHIISAERVLTELQKIMLSEKPSIGLLLLEETGLLEIILPELAALKGIEEIDGKAHKDNFYHTVEVVDTVASKTGDFWMRWAALFHDIGKSPTKKFVDGTGWTFHGHEFIGSKMLKKIFQRLKMPLGNELKFVEKLVRMHARPIALVDDGVSDSALRRLVFDAGDELEALFVLCTSDMTTKNQKKRERYLENFKLVQEKIRIVEEKDQIRNFQPPVSGEEIMAMFGIPPGKEIGILKEKVKEAILEGELQNEAEAARNYVLREGLAMGLTLQEST